MKAEPLAYGEYRDLLKVAGTCAVTVVAKDIGFFTPGDMTAERFDALTQPEHLEVALDW